MSGDADDPSTLSPGGDSESYDSEPWGVEGLPLDDSDSGETEWEEDERRAPAAVQIVSDRVSSPGAIAHILETGGFRPALSTCSDAVDTARQALPRCVIVDCTPGAFVDGLIALDEIRAQADRRLSTTRVIVIGHDDGLARRSYLAGADGFVNRPLSAAELLDQVHRVLVRSPAGRSEFRMDRLTAER